MSDHQIHEGPADTSNIDEAGTESVQGNDTVTLSIGRDPRETGTPVQRREWPLSRLAYVLTEHKRRAEKFGAYFCAPMANDRRNADNALPWNLFPLDFDGKEGDRPDPEISKAFFAGVWHVGYSTHSYTPENGKHRIVLLLNRAVDKTEYRALFDAFAEVLPFVPDIRLNHPDQPVFLPSCPLGTTPIAWINEGKPFDVDAFLERHKRHTEKESRARQAYTTPPQNSVIGQFNAAHDLVSILEQHGYQRRGKRYIHPHSDSGMPSVAILGDGNICVSHSSSDPLGDAKPHDCFDVWSILEHGGDKKAATRKAAELLGIQSNRQSQSQSQSQSQGQGQGQDAPWQEPLPFPSTLSPVAPFDSSMLPDALRGWIDDIADRMQCPPDFTAVGALVALSSVIGRKRLINPKRYDDWAVTPNLWGCVVGRPGIMKSPALAQVTQFLDRLQAKASAQHKGAMLDWEVAQEMASMAQNAANRAAQKAVDKGNTFEAQMLLKQARATPEEAEPPLRRYMSTDSTVEALAEILEGNPFGTLAYRDELHGLLKSLDKDGQESARSFYLQAYDGNQSWTTDRIVRGKHRRIEAVCLSLLGGIQPGKIESYIRAAVCGGEGDDGLLQRFGLLVWPDAPTTWKNVDRWPDTPAKNRAFELFETLDALNPDAEGQPIKLRFTPDAQGLFDEWRGELETEIRRGDLLPALESHLAKYRKLVPALALVIGLADGEREAISRLPLMRAVEWADYLHSHARRAYHAGQVPDTQAAASLLARIRAKDVRDGFRTREIYLKGWTHLSSVDAAKGAVALLVDLNHIRPIDNDQETVCGRPTVAYAINPKTLRG